MKTGEKSLVVLYAQHSGCVIGKKNKFEKMKKEITRPPIDR